MRTLIPGTLTILSAYPDPPFDVMKDKVPTGFDIELMRGVRAAFA
jgi:ABC-type amino acid transport substrate-binding protein